MSEISSVFGVGLLNVGYCDDAAIGAPLSVHIEAAPGHLASI